MRALKSGVGWVWDHLVGGVPVQLWVWRVAPRFGDWCERQARERDRRLR